MKDRYVTLTRNINNIILISLNVKSFLSAVGGVPVVPVAPEVTSSQFPSQDEVRTTLSVAP